MTHKPRKGDFGELKSEKDSPGEHAPRSPYKEACTSGARLGNRSVFILHICRSASGLVCFDLHKQLIPIKAIQCSHMVSEHWCEMVLFSCFGYPIHNCVAHTCYILSCWTPFWKVTEAGSLIYMGIQNEWIASGQKWVHKEHLHHTQLLVCWILKRKVFWH